MTNAGSTPPGWYPAPGDPPGTHRYWDGSQWTTGPQPIGQQSAPQAGGGFTQPSANYGMAAGPYGTTTPSSDYLPAIGKTLATPGSRIIARLIDAVLVFVVAIIFVGIVGASGNQFALGLLFTVLGFLYEVGLVATKGGTLGKMAMGIGVTTQADGTYPPGWQPAIMRWLPGVISIIPILGSLVLLVIFILSLVWLFNDPQHRTVYDKFAKTYVIKTK